MRSGAGWVLMPRSTGAFSSAAFTLPLAANPMSALPGRWSGHPTPPWWPKRSSPGAPGRSCLSAGAAPCRPLLAVGDLVVPTAAVIDEGTSPHYAAGVSAVCPSEPLMRQVAEACAAEGVSARPGTVWTTDAVFRETRDEVARHQRDGVLAVEMECSALFTVAGFRGIDVAALLVVSDDLSSLTWRPGFKDPRFIRGREVACNVIGKLCSTLAVA